MTAVLLESDGHGKVGVLGQRWQVSANWPHRLVRVEVDLTGERVRIYTMRRREPESPRAFRAPPELVACEYL